MSLRIMITVMYTTTWHNMVLMCVEDIGPRMTEAAPSIAEQGIEIRWSRAMMHAVPLIVDW